MIWSGNISLFPSPFIQEAWLQGRNLKQPQTPRDLKAIIFFLTNNRAGQGKHDKEDRYAHQGGAVSSVGHGGWQAGTPGLDDFWLWGSLWILFFLYVTVTHVYHNTWGRLSPCMELILLSWSEFGHGIEEVIVEDWCGITDGLPANGRRCRGWDEKLFGWLWRSQMQFVSICLWSLNLCKVEF